MFIVLNFAEHFTFHLPEVPQLPRIEPAFEIRPTLPRDVALAVRTALPRAPLQPPPANSPAVQARPDDVLAGRHFAVQTELISLKNVPVVPHGSVVGYFAQSFGDVIDDGLVTFAPGQPDLPRSRRRQEAGRRRFAAVALPVVAGAVRAAFRENADLAAGEVAEDLGDGPVGREGDAGVPGGAVAEGELAGTVVLEVGGERGGFAGRSVEHLAGPAAAGESSAFRGGDDRETGDEETSRARSHRGSAEEAGPPREVEEDSGRAVNNRSRRFKTK